MPADSASNQAAGRSSASPAPVAASERDRAMRAWKLVNEAAKRGFFDQYRNLVKGSASLVMSNGLISALTYFASRTGTTKDAGLKLAKHISGFVFPGNFEPNEAIGRLVELDSSEYMLRTREVLANLRWLRQFVDVIAKGQEEQR